jgi:hypothetical protein
MIYNISDKHQTNFQPSFREVQKQLMIARSDPGFGSYHVSFRAKLEIIPNSNSYEQFELEREMPGLSVSEQLEYINNIYKYQKPSLVSEEEYIKLKSMLK